MTGQNVSLGGDQKVFAGPRSDPFFFDLDAFNNTIHATGGRSFCANGQGVDFFAGLNTNAIVLKLNKDVVGTKVNIWGSTVSTNGKTQYDRMGRPAINTVFNGFKEVFNSGVDADKDTFNAVRNPLNDPTTHNGLFTKNVITVLQELSSLSGTPYTNKEASDLAKVLLPDRLPFDTSDHMTNGVFNGRALDRRRDRHRAERGDEGRRAERLRGRAHRLPVGVPVPRGAPPVAHWQPPGGLRRTHRRSPFTLLPEEHVMKTRFIALAVATTVVIGGGYLVRAATGSAGPAGADGPSQSGERPRAVLPGRPARARPPDRRVRDARRRRRRRSPASRS